MAKKAEVAAEVAEQPEVSHDEFATEVANLEAAVDDNKPEESPAEKQARLIGVLHERVKALEDAKGWHDAQKCKDF